MTVYLGKSPVGVGRIVEKKVAKEKFGATVDAFLGDVDANGVYSLPTDEFILDLTGVKSVPENAFYYGCAFKNLKKIIANDLIDVNKFSFADINPISGSSSAGTIAQFDNLEQITKDNAFRSFLQFQNNPKPSFKKLKKVAGTDVFNGAFRYAKLIPDEVFPVLEEVGGNTCFAQFMAADVNVPVRFSSLKKIVGSSASYTATFMFYNALTFEFPSATELSGYVFYSSGAKEIHFAAANQAAIEACSGYENKWGATNATIYFDL